MQELKFEIIADVSGGNRVVRGVLEAAGGAVIARDLVNYAGGVIRDAAIANASRINANGGVRMRR